MAVPRPCPTPLDDEDLLAYEEGALPPAEARSVGAHLQECAACRQRWQTIGRIGRLLQETFPLVDDPTARTALLARLGRPGQEPAWRRTLRHLHPSLLARRRRRGDP